MYNIRLAGLDTGRKYYVKVRAKVIGYETSEWSLPFRFESPKDTMPPGPVEFLRFVSEGDSFLANWAAPSVNADGSPCGDISHYKLKLRNVDTNVSVWDQSVDPRFVIDINKNASLFGALAGKIEITVTAVDLSGNEGIGVSAIAQNPPPPKVTNVTASVGIESIGLSWTQVPDTDLSHYEIHVGATSGFTPGPSTLRAKVAAGNDNFSYDSSSLSTLYFKIIAVDKFNQKSIPSDVVSAQPRLTTDYDKEPPGSVAGFTVTQVLASDNTSATARLSFTANSESDLDKYEVQYRKTGDTTAPWSFTNVPSDQTTAEVKPLPLSTSYDFRIRAVDFNANKGAWSSVVAAAGIKKTTLPAAPTGIVVTGGLTNLMVRWNASTDASMANWGGTYEVQISKATNFSSPITINTSSTLASFINLDPNTVYYVRIRAIDPYLNTGAWSVSANGNTGIVKDLTSARVFSDATAPANNVANALKVNDLWIRESDKRMHRWTGSAWVDVQDAKIKELDSKATDLIVNGTGSMGNNTNFPGMTYVQHDTPPGAVGAFSRDSAGTIISPDPIQYNKNKVYKVSVDAKRGAPGIRTRAYTGFIPYDNAGNLIAPIHYSYVAGTTTTLAQDLKPGDTQIHLTDSANWLGRAGGQNGATHQYRAIFWNYADSFGKLWAPETYSRNVMDASSWNNGGIDPNSHIITLNAPYSGSLVAAGTKVSNGQSGGNYMYGPLSATMLNDEWTNYIAILTGEMTQSVLNEGKPAATFATGVPPGTAVVRYMILTNHSSATDPGAITMVANISMSDASAAYDRASTALLSANARNRNVYSTLAAAGTSLNGYSFVNGDTWFRRDANGTIIGMWEFSNGAWVPRTLNNQVIANLDAGKINAGFLNAERIQAGTIDSTKIVVEGLDGSVVIQDGTIVAGKLAANSVTTEKLAADSVTANKIMAGEITGQKLATDLAVVNNLQIQSSVEINAAGGHIKSSNWNDTAKTGFYMDQQQLIVHNGRIEAAALRLQDSANIMPPQFASFNSKIGAYTGLLTSGITGITKVTGDGKFGGDSLQIVTNANGYLMFGKTGELNIPVESGQQYIVSFYVSNRASKVFSLQAGLYESGAILAYGTTLSIANSTAWTRYSVVVTAPANMNKAVLRLNPQNAPVTFRLDGIQIEKKISASDVPSNWSPPGYTSIDGESITTGAISSTATAASNPSIAAWSIDTVGRARFADATIDGKLIVGSDTVNNDNVAVQSDNYSTGIAGWAIKGNGDVEFNNGTFRGKLNLERAGLQEIPLKMSASVSNIKLFINDTDHQDINVASIRGVTYAYDRAQQGGVGTYYPTNPVLSKIGRYYFGPTTDRSVNIQVHEGEEDAVYLDTPPNDVALTSMYVGELTSPAVEPVERERQGFGFNATRIEVDPSTPSRKSSTGASQSSSVQLRSPFYPESLDGEYPESTHLFESKIDFKAPLAKNLFFRNYALPDATVTGGTTSRTNRPDYVSRAYDLTNEINKSTYVKVPVSGAGNPTGTKRHIFSAYIDTLDAFTDTAVYAFANNVAMNPIGDDKLLAGATEYQHANTLSTLAPDYRYEFNTAAASYSNSGSGSQVLTRTQGSVTTGPESSIFASVSTRYTAPSTYNMNLGMTFSVWFQPSYVSGEQVFFHRGATSQREIWIRYNATNRTFTGGMVSASTTTWSAPNNLIDPAKWNQVTFTFDSIGAGTKNMRIYVNGVLQFTQAITGWTTLFSDEPLHLFANLQATSFYLGGLSEPMVFHKVLTAAQVTSLYNIGTPIYRAGGFSTLSQNGILVESGNAAQRVAFEYTPSSTVATTITLQVVGASSNKVLAYKIQLERASYQENVNLSDRIRAKIAPTPWMTNGSNSLSTASLKLKAEPSPDVESWLISSLGDYQKYGPRGMEANRKKAPAELELSLASSYSYPGGGDVASSNATYKWSTTGMTYPGAKFPFMPAAASIIWDYNSLASTSRPQIGGSSNLITTINLANSSFGAINVGAGKSLEDSFPGTNGIQVGYPWIRVGVPNLPIHVDTIRIREHATETAGLPTDFVYHSEALVQVNQEATVRVDNTVVTFGPTYRYNGCVVINYDPNTDSGIFARVRDGGTRLWQIFVVNNGAITYTNSGTFTTAVNSWTDFTLRRDGSNVRIVLGNVTLFNLNLGTLPTGKYTGLSMNSGRLDTFKAIDIAAGSTAMGMLLPESVNVNQGRGIFVNPNGVIAVDVPGYYMVTGCVRGAIGGDIARTYWLDIFETRVGGETKTHPISGWHNRSSSDMDYVFGSGICYLEGTVEFRIITHTTNVSRISGADLHIVRMA